MENSSVIEEARAALREARGHLEDDNRVYPFKDVRWVTIKRYRELFNLASEDIVNDWIQQDIIKPDDIVDVNVLGGIRLIRAVNY